MLTNYKGMGKVYIMEKIKVNFLVGVEILDELKEIGKTDGLKVSEIIRRCISDYLLWRKAKPVNED